MNTLIKLYKLDCVSRLSRDFTTVFVEIGVAHLNPAHVVMLLRTHKTAQMRGSETWEPPILCITKIILTDGTVYYTDEPITAVQNKLFGGK